MVVEPRELLIHTLREKCAHTGPHIGCETSHCGACTVDMNGTSVKSCTVLTVEAQDAELLTIEGLAKGGVLHALQEGFMQEHGLMRVLHCGYVTRAYRLLQENPNPTDEVVRYWIAGNLSPLHGYQDIVKAVQYAARKLRAGEQVETSHPLLEAAS